MKERISVIITSLGNKKFLQRSINSVRSQTLVPWEIIVVIDGSNAEVVDWLENLNVSNLIVFETVSKRGGAGARNFGVSKSTGDWIAFLDDDDEWFPQKIEKQLSSIINLGKNNFCFTKTLVINGGKKYYLPRKKWENSLKIDEYLFKPKFGRTAGFIQTSSFFGPRNLFIEIPFTERLPKHQDWDWVLKARILGKINFIYLAEPLVIYHQDSVNSVGKVNNWKASFNWIKSWEDYIEKSSLNNFLISVPMSNVCFDPSLPLSTKRKIIKELKQFKFTLNSKYILILLKLYIFNIFYKKIKHII
ncbi:glycosyltransferase [Streptococcus uberis]|uniref:glycosyltransferase family 2 protein n=1 Tax=Streptococcus uberis TaxID=1349 RepID=UPI0021501236|nr:glycosyltransferase family 2 protein [Streptococcus uberis]MCR4257300.1 glycosyltransferase [Streptococcus uberis]